jgi:hypothetical protein
MEKSRYVKPQAQLLDRTLAVSIGGCAFGASPGTCGLPGNSAGTCNPSGVGQGVGTPCGPGLTALGGCSPVGTRANL